MILNQGDTVASAPIDEGDDEVEVKAIVVAPGYLHSPVAVLRARLPKISAPTVFVRPVSGTMMEVKLKCSTPDAIMHFTCDGSLPPGSPTTQLYPNKPARTGILRTGGTYLKIRAIACIGEVRSGVSEMKVKLKDFAQVDVKRKGDHHFELDSSAMWIGAGNSQKIETEIMALDDEEELAAGLAKVGHEMPQTQEWLRRRAAARSTDGWTTSIHNPVFRARMAATEEGRAQLQELEVESNTDVGWESSEKRAITETVM